MQNQKKCKMISSSLPASLGQDHTGHNFGKEYIFKVPQNITIQNP